MERKNAWEKYPEGKREEVFTFAEGYFSHAFFLSIF